MPDALKSRRERHADAKALLDEWLWQQDDYDEGVYPKLNAALEDSPVRMRELPDAPERATDD